MTILSIILQAAAPAPASSGATSMWVMLLAIFIIMYFFMIRPQRKQQKELEKFRSELKKGDKVVTVGGIYGSIDSVQEKTAIIRVDGDVKIRIDKTCLVRDISETQSR